ncbi:hypothetical protein [Corallincola spongiicola]|uniref:Uncharacterized protein n=1 Tax=Corallincola spongiicola TaxID=2520508 RepID=A0ABY1WV70_9GAMM|nr:hypothetical protein [Corallincola spongiicola]TAA48412.1 hypothetical protein EXY25_04095 [Corallincola spongiicola]
MGLAFSNYCETCNAEGPEVGDAGLVGDNVNIAPNRIEHDDGVFCSFGWIYDALQAISLVPKDIADLKAFLEQHHGHDLVTHCDHDEQEPNIDWDNLRKYKRQFSKDKDVVGCYSIRNVETDEVFESQTDAFRRFDKRILTANEIAKFLQDLADDSEVLDGFYRCSPTIDPYEDLEQIAEFIRDNSDDPLEVFIDES